MDSLEKKVLEIIKNHKDTEIDDKCIKALVQELKNTCPHLNPPDTTCRCNPCRCKVTIDTNCKCSDCQCSL